MKYQYGIKYLQNIPIINMKFNLRKIFLCKHTIYEALVWMVLSIYKFCLNKYG